MTLQRRHTLCRAAVNLGALRVKTTAAVTFNFFTTRQTRVVIPLTKTCFPWSAPGSAPPWGWQWRSCTVGLPPPCRQTHPEWGHNDEDQTLVAIWRAYMHVKVKWCWDAVCVSRLQLVWLDFNDWANKTFTRTLYFLKVAPVHNTHCYKPTPTR